MLSKISRTSALATSGCQSALGVTLLSGRVDQAHYREQSLSALRGALHECFLHLREDFRDAEEVHRLFLAGTSSGAYDNKSWVTSDSA